MNKYRAAAWVCWCWIAALPIAVGIVANGLDHPWPALVGLSAVIAGFILFAAGCVFWEMADKQGRPSR